MEDDGPIAVKMRTIKMREEEVSSLGKTIDSLMKKAEQERDVREGASSSSSSVGCLTWLVQRLTGRRRAAYALGESEMDRAAASSASGSASSSSSSSSSSAESASSGVNARIFGLAGAKRASEPAKMLESAAEVMKSRIQQLEIRAAEHRAEAARLVRAGQKGPAMRMLKKAKQVEASVQANQASLDAVEQQVDLLAQAAVQKTLTSALETTSKNFKGSKKLVARAEKAVDDVSEVRDMAEDLQNALSELGANASQDIDEDDLQMELDAMLETAVEAEAEPASSSERSHLTTSSAPAAAASLAKSVMNRLPSVPTKKAGIEKAALLKNEAQAVSAA